MGVLESVSAVVHVVLLRIVAACLNERRMFLTRAEGSVGS